MDLIDRQAAIDALADYIHNVDKVYSTGKLSTDDCKDAAKSVLDDLPSAQPEYYDYSDIDLVWKYYAEEQDINLTDGAKQLKDAMWVGYRKGKQDAQQWIPCSERLPENDCQCIVTAKVKHVDGYPDYEVDTADYTDGIFTTANSWWGVESIIAWMPLPEPYAERREE